MESNGKWLPTKTQKNQIFIIYINVYINVHLYVYNNVYKNVYKKREPFGSLSS